MPKATLKQGAKGPQVIELQEMLNRTGAMLRCDGDYGIATARAVTLCQGDAGQAPTGIADGAFWSWLEAQPEPCPDIATEAVNAIARFEVTSRFHYSSQLARPIWPKGFSGVTIGVGYDLKHQTPAGFRADWTGLIAPGQINQLAALVGKQGSLALADEVSDVEVPFKAAWRVFTAVSLPKFVAVTRKTYPGFNALPKLCRGVLVSLIYNRGADLAGERRTEMKAIKDHIANKKYAKVADELVAMKRLWPDAKGLRDRRDEEAGMWLKGLQ